MKNFRLPAFAFIGLIICLGFDSTPPASDIDVIQERIIRDLLEYPVSDKAVADIVEGLSADGSWPDINYVDTSRTGFDHARHLGRMFSLAKAFNQKSSRYYESKDALKAINQSLNYWLQHDFICANWWWNQIGTTRVMANILLLMKDQLSDDQILQTVRIVDRSHLEASGARPSGDRIKMAGILAQKLLVLRDEAQLEQVIQVIEGEIKFSEGRGMQVDFSFHHREDRVNNTLSYGLGYAQAFAQWAALVSGTRFQFGEPAVHQLVDYFLDGICKMMVHGKYPDLGAKNRSVSRGGALRPFGTEIIDDLLLVTTYRQDELKEIRAIRKGEEQNKRRFNKFFWQTEYMSHQRPGYFTSARMYSTRNQNMESPYNSEGLKNHYLGDGANFISRTGREYFDIFPVWDWRRIPGTTVVQKPEMPGAEDIREKGVTDFVGGVSDGEYGAAAFDYIKEIDSLSARKSWFYFDDAWVCLGAGIRSTSAFSVNTTLNQSRLHGPVYISTEEEFHPITSQSNLLRDDLVWVWHDSVGYFFPEGARVHVSNQTQSGSWADINQQIDSPVEELSENVFKLWIDHGPGPQDEQYAYFVVPAVSMMDMESHDYSDVIRVLSNTGELQAVQHRLLGMVQSVFYQPGTLSISRDLELQMENPGMVMVRYVNGKVRSICVADPSRKLEELHFSVSQRLSEVQDESVAKIRWDPAIRQTHVTVHLPRHPWAGSSVVLDFR